VQREYELLYIIVPELDQDATQALTEEVSQQIQDLGGKVENVRTSDVRRLAYEIGGYTEGVYVVVNFRSEGDALRELDRLLRLRQSVIRHMIVNVDD
jgi:small subunit ribosomal protein S6